MPRFSVPPLGQPKLLSMPTWSHVLMTDSLICRATLGPAIVGNADPRVFSTTVGGVAVWVPISRDLTGATRTATSAPLTSCHSHDQVKFANRLAHSGDRETAHRRCADCEPTPGELVLKSNQYGGNLSTSCRSGRVSASYAEQPD